MGRTAAAYIAKLRTKQTLSAFNMIDYTAAAETYDHTRTYSDDVIDRFCATVPLDSSVSILDFGCGTGNYLSRIHQRFDCRCYGVDPADGMLSKAISKASTLNIERGDHRAIPFPSESFEFAYMTDVVHHIPSLPAMFRELLRVLKVGGFLCIVTESHAQIDGRFYNRYFPSLAANEKRRYPDVSEITTHGQHAGFHPVSTEMATSQSRQVSDAFLRNVAEKNWSMFRLLSEQEFSNGLRALSDDLGRSFEPSAAGTTFLWFRKDA